MFLQYRTQGLILKREDRGEADQLFTVFTRDFGKLEILGKGIRKISSKLRPGVETFYLSEIEFIQGKTQKTLTDAISIEKFQRLRKDLGRLNIAYKISEIFDEMVKGQERDEKIWSLLKEVFQKLNKIEPRTSNIELFYYYFFWNLISILGYKPELYHCSICQKKLKPERLLFSEKEGGIICYNCFKEKETSIGQVKEISPEIVKLIRIFLEKNWPVLIRLKIGKKYLESLEEISQNYSDSILEKNKT